MSAFTKIADQTQRSRDVRKVPISGLTPAQQYVQSLPFFASALAGSLGRSADLPYMQLIVFHHILNR